MPDDHTLPAAIRTATAVTGGTYELPVYPFVEPAELRGERLRHPVVIVGAGLTGLTAACDCALRGIPAVVLDEDDTVGVRGAASRGICYAQKSLEIYKRLGIHDRMLAKGIQWSVGRTFAGSDEVYSFDLKKMQTHSVSEQPPFINLQQFYLEWFLVERIYELGLVELRWKNRLIEIAPNEDHVVLTVVTPSGPYTLEASWVIDCCGAHSVIRDKLGVHATGSKIPDRWCISDVRFEREPPAERWTWIEAPFNENRAVWQHLMADRVWRLDYQMPADADPEAISRPEVVADRLRRQFGPDVKYELVWVGPYAYRSLCLDTFRVGRVLFAGDAAHVMSPFGARGGNSGIQDADNLVWKLALVLEGKASERLLDSYAVEQARAGLFPASIAVDVSAERLARFF
ncbi:FAD-binding protein, partial [Betaproteobacteria bacterium PRO7]|nr:FAD-binding protein [Betaproteobacteria bacterium PRO7]